MSKKVCSDSNQTCARIAYKFSEVSAIYPITPSSPMAEFCDELCNAGEKNLFGQPLKLFEMQSEAGVAGAVHGSLLGGALSTTFTASQGLLLMLPNMFKIAGEFLPAVFHVSARAVATHALSIFGDHSDVMSARGTGFAMICSNNAQEAQDMACVAHISAIKSRVPFLHFFDGFRTSHEIQKYEQISDEELLKLLPNQEILEFKNRCLNPQKPIQMGTAQNPDVFFQNREAGNVVYNKSLDKVLESFNEIEKITGRKYAPFEYVGHKNAENVIISMGSSCETIEDFINVILNSDLLENDKKIGLVKVRLYRPFSVKHLMSVLPASVKKITVLDRTKEQGAVGDPLYLDVISALKEANVDAEVFGGRYGLGSKEFDSKQVAYIFENLKNNSTKNHFTVGIFDDVNNSSLHDAGFYFDKYLEFSKNKDYQMLFYGLGSDGTVSANKNSIKIIGSATDKYVQGYFEYDSKKSGSLTVSHLRVSDEKIQKIYEVQHADFIACHNFSFIDKFDILQRIKKNGTFLLNTVLSENELNEFLPNKMKKEIFEKNVKLYIINANEIAQRLGLKNKINVIMQSAFFKVANILPFEDFLSQAKNYIVKTYGRKGEQVVSANINALNEGGNVQLVDISKLSYDECELNEIESVAELTNDKSTIFNKEIMQKIMKREGNEIPVSKFSIDGAIITDTAKFEKRGIAEHIPCWKSENCIQCGRCALVCPHAAIRAHNISDTNLKDAPEDFKTVKTIGDKLNNYKIQVSPLDCTGCGVCASVCPAKNKALVMVNAKEILEKEKRNYDFVEKIENEKTIFSKFTTKGNQFEKPYFEFNGACAGCGETPYLKLLSTLFGENLIIANATGCSSIYSGSYPSCPFAKNKKGFGPAWANSLFEDNAEFGLGIKLASNCKKQQLQTILSEQNFEDEEIENIKLKFISDANSLSNEEAEKIINCINDLQNGNLKKLKDEFYKKSVWIVGGDGWAYDIGYGGLDHVLNSNENVNILVLDTEVYSNTGGQASKSTNKGAVAKFASSGKLGKKKDLGLIAVASQNAYVAKIAMGANYEQTIKAFKEAEEFDGPSLIIAYAPCVNHGIDMSKTQEEMKKAVDSGYWELYRYNPKSSQLSFDSQEPTMSYEEFLLGETRFSANLKANPEKAKELFLEAQNEANNRRNLLLKLTK